MTELKTGWRRWRFEQMAQSVNDRVDDPRQSGVEPVGWGDEGTPTRSCRPEDVGVRSSPQPKGSLLLSASLRELIRK